MSTERSTKGTHFEAHRDRLRGLAYRLTGSVTDTDDVLQDAYLRWQNTTEEVAAPGAYLSKLVTRLCLDLMTSARVRRETYVGPWLPEPLLGAPAPVDSRELASDVTFALMLALERLTPLERAAFILHDVFDLDYAQVAETLGRQEATCRQLAARARRNVRRRETRSTLDEAAQQSVIRAFFSAALTGDTACIEQLLAEHATFYSDGGGHVRAALKPIYGRDKVSRFVVGVRRKFPLAGGVRLQPARINGGVGYVIWLDERPMQTTCFEFEGELISAVYVVSNPAKLQHLEHRSACQCPESPRKTAPSE